MGRNAIKDSVSNIFSNVFGFVRMTIYLRIVNKEKMPIQIEIKDSQIPVIARIYADRLNEINELLTKLTEEKNDVESLLKVLHAPKSVAPIENGVPPISLVRPPLYGGGEVVPVYNPKATIREKIKFVLKKEKQPMSSREIAEKLFVMEPSLNADRNKAVKNVSTVLSILASKGVDVIKNADKYSLI